MFFIRLLTGLNRSTFEVLIRQWLILHLNEREIKFTYRCIVFRRQDKVGTLYKSCFNISYRNLDDVHLFFCCFLLCFVCQGRTGLLCIISILSSVSVSHCSLKTSACVHVFRLVKKLIEKWCGILLLCLNTKSSIINYCSFSNLT